MSEKDREIIKEKSDIFNKIAANFDVGLGKTTSKAERAEKGLSSGCLTYGEIEFDSFAEVFIQVKNQFQCF